MKKYDDTADQMIAAIRRVMRAVDLHSRTLATSHGLTGPQALLLKALQSGSLSAGELATRINLSQGTVTDILKRLEHRQLIRRIRDTKDRRRVIVELTEAGLAVLEQAPPLLQDRFAQRFNNLQDWDQNQLVSSLQRIASMMDAEDIDAAPLLSSGSVLATVEAVEEVLEPDSQEDQQPDDTRSTGMVASLK